MKIEYEQFEGTPAWKALFNGQIIGRILVQQRVENGEVLPTVSATEATGPEIYNKPIPGSPFASVNQAKAAMEYHFRNLTEAA